MVDTRLVIANSALRASLIFTLTYPTCVHFTQLILKCARVIPRLLSIVESDMNE